MLAFLSDIHFGKGSEDMKAYNFALKILADMQPQEIFLGGDIFEHEPLSSHRKSPEVVDQLQAELDHGFAEMGRLVNTCPSAAIEFYSGNHEKRSDNLLMDKAKALAKLKALNRRNLYRLDELGIKYHETSTPVKKGHLWLGHGDEFSTGGVNPAHTALNDLNTNILFGHVHRVSTASKRQLDGRSIVGWSNSCLRSLSPKWVLQPDWTQGLTLVDFTVSGYFSIAPVVFWYEPKYRCLRTIVNGKLYDSRNDH